MIEPNTQVWRYMSFAKFVSLLQMKQQKLLRNFESKLLSIAGLYQNTNPMLFGEYTAHHRRV